MNAKPSEISKASKSPTMMSKTSKPPKLHRPAVILMAVLGHACTRPAAPEPRADSATAAPIRVASVVAATASVPRLLPLTGTLKASAESAVAANANGRISRTLVERGSVVAKGAPLVILDQRMASLSAAEARANLEGIRSQKQLADSTCERNRRLFQRHVITAEEFEKADSTCRVQSHSLAAAESRQRQATVSLTDATVRAPFAGVVLERLVNVGEYVTANTKIVELVQSDPVRLELVAGEQDAAAVHVGQAVTFEVKAMPGQSFTATVRYVAPALREATRDLVFEAVAPNADGRLRPGMFATAWLEVGTESTVVVPRTALWKSGETIRAFVIKNGHLEERVVHVGRDLEGRTTLKAGVAAGERIVREASGQLKDGSAVVDQG
jgi:membrane fusion protein, multidrug efflux system